MAAWEQADYKGGLLRRAGDKTLSPRPGVAARWLAGWLRPALVLVAGWLSLAGWLPKSGLLADVRKVGDPIPASQYGPHVA